MRHATLGDYEPPESDLSPEERQKAMDEIPDYIFVVSFAGTEKKPRQFWDKEKELLLQQEYPIAMSIDEPFEELFGPTWNQAGKQNKTTAPEGRITALGS